MKQNHTAGKEHLYLRIAGTIEQQIVREVWRVGDRLPSIRMICREHGVSMSTAMQAYYELERKALIESRPQSGYYVARSPRRQLPIPPTSKPSDAGHGDAQEDLMSKVFHSLGKRDVIRLSLGVPADELLPIARLNKGLVQAMRALPGSGTAYEDVQGNVRLRRGIARWAFSWDGRLDEEDIVTTAGCMDALSYCIMALTRRGDTIAVESPVYTGILQLARSLGLKVLELPTHARTGVDPDDLKKVLPKIKVCLLVSNFNNPLGSCMPDEHKKAVVQLMEQYNVPLIEDDIYGDVYFGDNRPRCCKTYDESGIVLWCGSVSKTLAPGYRVGWVAPGRFKEQIVRAKLLHAISSTTITQEVIAGFLDNGRYESHLRRLRHTLHGNCLQFTRAIADHFPEGTRVSRPQGGFVLWVDLDKKIDTAALYEDAIRQRISIAPGSMFTLKKQFGNCMRLSYGLAWNAGLDDALRQLGDMVKKRM